MSIDAKAMITQVRAELDRRNGCPRHHFEARVRYQLGDKLTCTVCGCSMRTSEIALYARGYRAAGGDPDDVLQGVLGGGA